MKSICHVAIGMLILGSMSALAMARDPAIHDAGWKVRGDYYPGSRASTYQQHAQDYARQCYYQAQIQPAAPKVLQEQAAAVKKNIEMSSKDLESLKVTTKKDAEAQKLIASILEHHENALKHSKHLEECCANNAGELETAKCCADIDTELEAAKADMAKLLKHLKIEPLPAPKKLEASEKSKK